MAELTVLNLTLASELGLALKAHGYMLALAESCTGGMVAEVVTSIAGSSHWFERGFVTYSNQAKMDMLSVATQTLETYGAVSEQTAQAMALGALKHSQAQIAASITGIAGPDGGSIEKPVGTVCFAWATKDGRMLLATHHFAGDRTQVRQLASQQCLLGLLSLLK